MTGSVPTVLVVGAGPVGLVAACELARQGVRPRLVDRLTEPSLLSRAVIVHARSQEMLATLGALDGLESRARSQTAVEAHAGDDSRELLARIEMGGMPTRYPRMLSLPQSDTEAVLAARATELGVEIERGVELTALHQSDGGVDATLRSHDGEETSAFDWVVGADGAHSTVRSLVGTALVGQFHGQHFLLADVDAELVLSKDAMHMFSHRDGAAALFPMAGDRVRVIFEVPAPAPGAEPTLDDVRRLGGERMAGLLHVSSSHWLTYFEVHHGQVPKYRFDRVFLVGDAAHIHSPLGGQGMNTGVQDAANVAWKLALVAQRRADPSLLDSYETERYPIAAGVVRMTTAMTTAMTAHGVAGFLREWALFAAGHTSALMDTAAARMAELTVGYPHSAIVGHSHSHSHWARALHPGAHAADVPGLQRPDTGPVAIGDLLRQPGHLVLACSRDLDRIAALGDALGDLGSMVHVVHDGGQTGAVSARVVDTGGELARTYGLGEDGFVAIRPDGYIGYLAAPADSAALRRYLADHLAISTGH